MQGVTRERCVTMPVTHKSNANHPAATPVDGKTSNDLRLNTFSRSLEDLTRETLYSRWKRARNHSLNQQIGVNQKSVRPRSISLVTRPHSLIIEKTNVNETKTRRNSFYELQQTLLRPRGWSNEDSGYLSGNTNEESMSDESPSLCSSAASLYSSGLPSTSDRDSLHTDKPIIATSIPEFEEIKVFAEAAADCIPNNTDTNLGKTTSITKATEKYFNSVPPWKGQRQRQRSCLPNNNSREVIPTEATLGKLIDMPPYKKLRNRSYSETDATPSNERTRNALKPARPTSAGKYPSNRKYGSTVVSGSEPNLETPVYRGNVNSTRHESAISFTVISQPFRLSKKRRTNKNYRTFSDTVVYVNRDMDSDGYDFTKLRYKSRSHSETGEDETDEQECSPERQENRAMSFTANSQSLLKRRVTIHEPPRGYSRSDRQNTLQRLQSLRRRHAVQELLKTVSNVSGKTENERIEGIEKAFSWIRKELAELREQDKDIMRMFTKIQAGIRQLKVARTVSECSDVSVEEESIGSEEFVHVPVVKTFSEPPRRMSVV